jgi:peptidoglycan DL-endopeptidase CwlO
MRARTLPDLLATVVLTMGLVAGVAAPASADAVSDKKAEAARIATKIEKLQTQAELLAEQYNKARYDLGVLEKELAVAEAQVASRTTESQGLRAEISRVAVRSYVYGAGDSGPLTGVLVDQDTPREAYLATIVGDITDTVDQVNAARDDAARIQKIVADKKARKAKLIDQTEKSRLAAAKATKLAETELVNAKGELKDLIIAEQVRKKKAEDEAAARAYAAKVAQEKLVRERAARTPDGPKARLTPAVPEAPASSPATARVIAAARSQLGVPYVWAAASPGQAFDCSGLTLWAWGTVGVGMGHWTVSQYADFPHVPFGKEQPGDLVFFGSPPHHVGIYVGNGQMIHAPYTGTVVQYGNAFGGDYIGAVRPG